MRSTYASLRPSRAAARAALAAALAAGLGLGAHALHSPAAAAQDAPDAAERAAIADAARLSQAFTAVSEQVSHAVVSLRVETPQRAPSLPFFFPMPGGGDGDGGIARGQGSGVLVDPDGLIVTNHHVVAGSSRIDVVLQDGRRFEGRVVGTDPPTDLAVVKIEARGLPALRFASRAPRVGEWVVAVGSPFGLDTTVTAGVVSGVGRGGFGANEIEDYLQTDASINPGNSGGPLVNLEGDVLGINTMIIGRGTGIGFAVPADLAQRVTRQLIDDGRVRRAWLGVGFQELTPELAAAFGAPGRVAGAVISNVVPDGPAARGGLRAGDVVISVDGRPVAAGRDLLRAVIRVDVGDRLRLGVLRDGREQTVTVATAERPGPDDETGAAPAPPGKGRPAPRAPEGAQLGLGLEPITPGLARRLRYEGPGRVVVSQVAPGSPASRAGLRPGDVVIEADRREVGAVADVERALSDGQALLRVERDGGGYFTVLRR